MSSCLSTLHLWPTSAWQIALYFILSANIWLSCCSTILNRFNSAETQLEFVVIPFGSQATNSDITNFILLLGLLVLAFRFQGSWRSLPSTFPVLPGNGKSLPFLLFFFFLIFLFCADIVLGFKRVKFGNWLKARLSCEIVVDLLSIMCRQLAGHLNCLLCSGFWIPSAVVERVIHYVWHDWRICGGIKWDYGLELFHPLPAHTRASPLPITHPFPLPAFFAGLVIDLLAFSPLSLCPPSRVYLYVCVCVIEWVFWVENSFKLALRILLLSKNSHSAHCFKSSSGRRSKRKRRLLLHN